MLTVLAYVCVGWLLHINCILGNDFWHSGEIIPQHRSNYPLWYDSHPCLCVSVWTYTLFVCLDIFLSACMPVCLPACLLVALCLSVCLPVCRSLSVSISLNHFLTWQKCLFLFIRATTPENLTSEPWNLPAGWRILSQKHCCIGIVRICFHLFV